MSSLVVQIGDALDALADATDPIGEVAAVDRLERLVRRARAGIVRNAIAATTYTEVGRALGMTRQGVAKAFPRARDDPRTPAPCSRLRGQPRIDPPAELGQQGSTAH
jgi:hypothetical protein